MLYYTCSPKTAGFGKSASFPAEETNTVVLSSFSACRKRRFLFAKKMRLCLRQILKGGMENAQ